MLDSKIELIKGDDTDFLNQVFLIISFKTNLDLSNYKCRFSIENAYSLIKSYEIQNNTIEINLDKTVSSTIEVGKHRCNLKLIDSLNRLKTIYYFDIYVKDEYDPSISLQNEYEIEIKLDDGISKYKNYEELLNKPLINNVELIGNKTLDELGITDLVDSKLKNYVTKDDLKITEIPDISNLATKDEIPTVPTNVSDFINDAGYLTEHQDISNLATKDEIPDISHKQDVIVDLDTIRAGAELGETALQSYTETDPIYMADKPNLALKSEIPDISGKADKSTTYTKTEIDSMFSSNLGNIETLLSEV